jgi:ABC-2 type transport system permease protein
MRKIYALLRARWIVASSYRMNMIMSLGGLVLTVIPVFFVSQALQPVMADKIRFEGTQYFGFLLVGMATMGIIGEAVTALPSAISGGIGNGTLEALLSTPTRLSVLLIGLSSYSIVWRLLRTIFMLGIGVALGASIAWSHVPSALLVLTLVILSYVPFGIFASALIVAFRTAGPLSALVLVPSSLLGGVYYPTHVIPSWIERVSDAVPLTYGLRALRRVLLEGVALRDVWSDLAVVVAMTAVLLAASLYVFSWALRYARRAGTLAHY